MFQQSFISASAIGRIARAPRFYRTNSGVVTASLAIALVRQTGRSTGGALDNRSVEQVEVAAVGRYAEADIFRLLRKLGTGDLILVEGEPLLRRIRSWSRRRSDAPGAFECDGEGLRPETAARLPDDAVLEIRANRVVLLDAAAQRQPKRNSERNSERCPDRGNAKGSRSRYSDSSAKARKSSRSADGGESRPFQKGAFASSDPHDGSALQIQSDVSSASSQGEDELSRESPFAAERAAFLRAYAFRTESLNGD